MPARRYRPKPRDEVRRNMAAIRSRDNKTEAALGRALHAMGLRYRKYRADLPGRPDLVFPAARVAVFVDGDYWHGRLLVEGGRKSLAAKLRRLPPESRRYWRDKFTRRVARDAAVTAALEHDGWRVIRHWESDVKADVDAAARAIADEVRRLTPPRAPVRLTTPPD